MMFVVFCSACHLGTSIPSFIFFPPFVGGRGGGKGCHLFRAGLFPCDYLKTKGVGFFIL